MFRRFYSWLFIEPLHVWLCVAVCLLSGAIALRPGAPESTIRLVGLCLQLAGILTVVWGILKTRQFFGLTSPLIVVQSWGRRCPLIRRPIIVELGVATEANDTLSARGYQSWPIDPTTTAEERIASLERNLPLLQKRISMFQSEFDTALRGLTDQVRNEEQERLSTTHQLQLQVKAHGTGGLHISAIGAAWLFVGAILGTASQEIAALLK